MISSPLVGGSGESMEVGNKTEVSGMVFMRRYLRDQPDRYAIVSFSFFGKEHLNEVWKVASLWNLVGFDDTINLVVNPQTLKVDSKEPGPDDCPYHGTPLSQSRQAEWLFCPQKLLDGSFCKFKKKK